LRAHSRESAIRFLDRRVGRTNDDRATGGNLENRADRERMRTAGELECGGPGKSLNSYNTVRKQWQQFWVDSGGEVHEYAGNLVDGEMRFEGPAADYQGNKTLRRMVFHRLDGGRVKQTGFTSPDGKEWTVEYELIYIPKSL
jgi:hypothetical protein